VPGSTDELALVVGPERSRLQRLVVCPTRPFVPPDPGPCRPTRCPRAARRRPALDTPGRGHATRSRDRIPQPQRRAQRPAVERHQRGLQGIAGHEDLRATEGRLHVRFGHRHDAGGEGCVVQLAVRSARHPTETPRFGPWLPDNPRVGGRTDDPTLRHDLRGNRHLVRQRAKPVQQIQSNRTHSGETNGLGRCHAHLGLIAPTTLPSWRDDENDRTNTQG
jgi:hypothetical protein